MKSSVLVTSSLRWATGLLFLGKTLQGAWSVSPVVEFLGYESVMHHVVSPWMSWESYAIEVYPGFSESIALIWTLIYATAFGAVLASRRWLNLILPGIVLLCLDVFMGACGQYHWLPAIFEKTLMWSTPICYLSVAYNDKRRIWIPLARYAIMLVFLVHGLYAINVFPRPGYWVEMIGQTTGIPMELADQFICIIGLLDILAAGLLLLRLNVPRMVWFYLIGWGSLTALGRLSGYVQSSDWSDLLINWSYETLIRVPHGLVPLALYLFLHRKSNDPESRPFPEDLV